MKKKILFILHLPPPIHGSSMVGKNIKESSIINNVFDCRYINLSTSKSVDEIGKKPFIKLLRYISILIEIIKELICFRPNLCYITITAKGRAFYKDSISVLLIKLFGVKIVYHMHNKGVLSNSNKFIDNLLYKFIFNNIDVILLSKYLYPDIERYVRFERIHICPNGIPDIDFTSLKRGENNNKKIEILFLSNLIESKGVFILLEACKILYQKGNDFHCSYVGGEGTVNAQQFNEKVKELNLTNQINYLGKKYGHEKEEAFLCADIFVFPTFNETFGLVNLEAMQYSLPIVSTFEGGIPEVVDDGINGFLVKQRDSIALADKIETLIHNSELRKSMGKLGREKYEREFTLDIFEEKMKDILMKIVYA